MASRIKTLELVILCVVLMGTLVVPRASSRSLRYNALEVFEEWMEEHGRTYSSSEEKAKRFAIFKAQGGAGFNAFSDMTYEEFLEETACTYDIPDTNSSSSFSNFRYQDFKVEDLPESWDWRTQGAVTNVKNQGGRCGACWAFATAAALEGLTPFYNKPYGKLMNLSVQQLIACSKDYGNNGCNNGTTIRGMMYVREHGLVREEKFPYRFADDQPCAQDPNYYSPPDIKISSFEVAPEFDEVALAKAVYHQPVAVAHSVSDVFRQHKGSGIFMDADGECAKGNISHSSTLVGFGKNGWGEEYWILKNSWGESWGENGTVMRKLEEILKISEVFVTWQNFQCLALFDECARNSIYYEYLFG